MFVFYDFETTGTSPAFDQPLQFAAIQTDDDLNPTDRIDIRCRLSPHILPAPWAMAVTGLTPDQLTDPSLPSLFEFTQTLAALIKTWGPATWVGYNSISFDEEMLRQALYQNLHPSPYMTQLEGNDRMDVMKMVYAVWELANDALFWPIDDKGRTSFKLDRLAPANGINHHDAHDALGDVEATIHIAKIIRDRAPTVWRQCLRNRSKHDVNDMLQTGDPLRLVERFGAAPPRSYFGAFAGRSLDNPNSVGFFDLELSDPGQMSAQDDKTVFDAVAGSPKLIRTVTVNKCPLLFPIADIGQELLHRAQTLAAMSDLHKSIGSALAKRYADREQVEHVEQKIYGGFYSNEDQALLKRFQETAWEDRFDSLDSFEDQRIKQLGRRLVFQHRPDLLDPAVVTAMSKAIRERWNCNDADSPWMTFEKVDAQIEEIAQQSALNLEQIETLSEFYATLRT